MSDDGDWTCACGRANVRVAATCLACGKPRGAASSPDAPTVDGARVPADPAAAKTVDATADASGQKTVAEPAPAPKPEPRPTARRGGGGPKCAACGYENKPAAVICGLCQAPLAAKPAPPEAAAPRGNAAEEARAASSAQAYRDLAAMKAGRVPARPAVPEVYRAQAAAAAAATLDPESTRRSLATCGALALGCGVIWAFSGVIAALAFSGAMRQAALSTTPVAIDRPAELLRLERDENVKLGAGTPEWTKSILRAKTSDRRAFEFFSADPRTPLTVLDADDLIARREELIGCIVTLAKAPPFQSYLWEVKIEYRGRYDKTGTRLENPTRIYCCLSGTLSKVWCVSDYFASETTPAAQEWLKHERRTGRLLPLDVPESVHKKWKESHGAAIPKDAVEIYELSGEVTFSEFEVWAPIEGTDGRLWVAYPGDLPPPATFLQGIWVRGAPNAYASRTVPQLAPMTGVLRLASLAQDTIRDRKAAEGSVLAGFSPAGLLPLVLGVLLLVMARAQRPASG